MKKAVVLSKSLKIDNSSDLDILYLKTRNELAYTLVREKGTQCLVLDLDGTDQENLHFLKSIKLNFPLLDSGVVLPMSEAASAAAQQFRSELPGYAFFEKDDDISKLNSMLKDFIYNSKYNNQRESNRFCWPLKAYFSTDSRERHTLEIFSISPGGAYLKSTKLMPEPGTSAFIKIEFHNFNIECKCLVNDSKTRSSNYPFGFSVRFTEINEKSQKILKNIIDDAVIKILLDPTAEPEVPSLDSEELSIDMFTL